LSVQNQKAYFLHIFGKSLQFPVKSLQFQTSKQNQKSVAEPKHEVLAQGQPEVVY
jgi:hypothetical protein